MSDGQIYIHGYEIEEQNRLRAQASLLEFRVYQDVNFAEGARVLEVGSGVGAQTEVLLRRFPTIQVTSIDREPTQTLQAQLAFREHADRERVSILTGDASQMPFPSGSFDGAFICWMLEHVPKPAEILKDVRRCLKPGSQVFLNEVFNRLFYVGPKGAAFDSYWEQFNLLQEQMGGDPYVGVKLGNLLSAAGFQDVQTEIAIEHHDARDWKKRAIMVDYLKNLLASAAPALLKAGRVDQLLIEEMKRDLEFANSSAEGVFHFGWVKASARA